MLLRSTGKRFEKGNALEKKITKYLIHEDILFNTRRKVMYVVVIVTFSLA